MSAVIQPVSTTARQVDRYSGEEKQNCSSYCYSQLDGFKPSSSESRIVLILLLCRQLQRNGARQRRPTTVLAEANALFYARLFMARDSNTYPDGVDQIVADQAGCDCDRKLGSGRR